ncbi:hypothetical protein BOX15_Mlig007808g1 [Macrostomum lignano]|uniref:Exostosin domain-containing protein n=2 Tax=Macrostomum lignano TaxID=282301 RepID=A0A267H1U9_9PLAT|nr:hypothetical protein BOX15_Mlig007808g1 [Macrostomum lignano]
MPVNQLIRGPRRSLATALLLGICLVAATHLILPILSPLPQPAYTGQDAVPSSLPDYAQPDDLHAARLGRRYLNNDQPSPWGHPVMDMSCSMHTCFNFSRCRQGFTVYVYPKPTGEADGVLGSDDESNAELSGGGETYDKILRAIRLSPYYTDDPEKACIFVPGIDTLDRDSLSPRFKAKAAAVITGYSHWHGRGENHLIFNLYAGTWPNYYEHELGIPTNRAILAKASFSTTNIRSLFDLSFPLVHSQHPLSAPAQTVAASPEPYLAKARRPILLSFKGKRYVIGSGSASRNSLYHLDNGKDILLFTTCKHGDNWRRYSDSRCALDNARYGMWDYDNLLQNSTFCLVPRGRRLGSYRFLEVLQAGCIPVVLSNDWELPFSEVIDWRRAAVWADERQLLQLPDIVRSIPDWRVIQMRQQCRFLYSAYFSSVQSIVRVTLEILADRIAYLRRPGLFWNSRPGGLLVRPQFSLNPCYYPFYGPRPGPPCPAGRVEHVTAVLFCGPGCHNSLLLGVLRSLTGNGGLVRQIFVAWRSSLSPTPPSMSTLRRLVGNKIRIALSEGGGGPDGNPLSLIEMPDWSLISQDAVLLINASALSAPIPQHRQQQLQQLYRLAFSVWRAQTDRAVGLQGGLHFYDDFQERWSLTTAPASGVSCLLGPVLMLHRYYAYLMSSPFAERLRRVASVFDGCDLLAWSFLVSHVTGRPPAQLLEHRTAWAQPEFLGSRQLCLQPLVNALGSAMPLTVSRARMDPVS